MGLIFKVFPLLVFCVLISAQEDEDSDRQSRRKTSLFDTSPIRRLIGDQDKQDSSLFAGGIQSFLNSFKQRTQELRQTFLDQQAQLKERVRPLLTRKEAIEKEEDELEREEKELERKIKGLQRRWSDKVEQFRRGLKEQKDIINKQMRVSAPKGSAADVKDLKKEKESVEDMLSEAGEPGDDVPRLVADRDLD